MSSCAATTTTRGGGNERRQHQHHHRQTTTSARRTRTRTLDSSRHVFHTKLALGLALLTLTGLVLLSVLFAETTPTTSSASASTSLGGSSNRRVAGGEQPDDSLLPFRRHRSDHVQRRQLDENNNNDNNDNNDSSSSSYESYSCHDLYNVTPTPGDDQCSFARTCNQGDGLWAPFVFCRNRNTWHYLLLLSPVMLLWLVLLFRLLGSTAEDYFSPSLEMFSTKLGLPPRFAGVTLLALGNGAADVSATVSAIGNDPTNGYKLSLGALTGAAMVIGSVVSALVVLVAGGVPCRGALVRDVLALGVCVVIVWQQLGSSNSGSGGGGVVGPETVTLFLSLYAVFVVLVLVADVYHRAVVLPRRAEFAREQERQRQLRGQRAYEQEQQQQQQQQQQATSSSAANDADSRGDCEMTAAGGENDAGAAPTTPSRGGDAVLHAGGSQGTPVQSEEDVRPAGSGVSGFSKVLTAFSNYDNDPEESNGAGWAPGSPGDIAGVDSDDLLAQDRPILLHGTHGILNSSTTLPSSTAANGSGGGGGGDLNSSNMSNGGGVGLQTESPHGGDGTLPGITSNVSYAMLEDAVDRACTEQPPGGLGLHAGGAPTSWKEAFSMARTELFKHLEETWDDICYNGDIDVLTKCLLLFELPFSLARKVTVAIPCEGFYVRALIALSLVLSPLWLAFYMWRGHEINLFVLTIGDGHNDDFKSRLNVWFMLYWAVALVAGLLVLRFAPAGSGSNDNMSLLFATPIALYGFIMAATWIDTIADSLVSLLDFIGIVLHIPGPIVGLTILAWGNSMSDLSADVTMARKGLANMAMTACFAGPFFNILVGLGLGFYSLAAQTGQAEREVELSPSITTGFLFIAINSLVILLTGLGLGKGRIPKKYGYIALTLYSIYLMTSITLQYSSSSG